MPRPKKIGDKLQFTMFLHLKKSGGVRAVMTKNLSPEPDSIVIQLAVNVPQVLFERPSLRAFIDIDQKEPYEIPVEVSDNIQEAIEKHLGVPVTLEVRGPGDGGDEE